MKRLKNISLWRDIINAWKAKKYNPLDIRTMLEYYYRGAIPGYSPPPARDEITPPSKEEAARILARIGEMVAKIGKIG